MSAQSQHLEIYKDKLADARITRHIDSVHVDTRECIDTGDCVSMEDYSRQKRIGRYSSWVR